MHLTIRADGGSALGYGHLVRSGALAEEFLARGHRVTVATTTPQPAEEVFPQAVETAELPSRGDPTPFIEHLDTTEPDVVFTDAYPIDTAYQRAIRERISLAVLQDDARHAVCADMFVNGNLYAPALSYEFVGSRPELCLGTEYLPLRRAIREFSVETPPWRDPPERAIITLGASDIAALTPTVVRAFDGLSVGVDAIVGPGFSAPQERAVRDAATAVSPEVRVVRDPVDLAERMFQADIAVSTASSTIYELLALGTPIVSIPVADNQERIARALADYELATVLERGADGGAFREAIVESLSDAQRRRTRRERGRELVDGRGTARVATRLETVGNAGDQQ